jgi:hypothetical protein
MWLHDSEAIMDWQMIPLETTAMTREHKIDADL